MINTTCYLLRAKINVMTLQYCIESGVSFVNVIGRWSYHLK